MTSPSPQKNYFLVYAPDGPNSHRGPLAEEHMKQNEGAFKSGFIRLGGGLLPPGTKSTDSDALQKLTGSFVIVQAETEEQVWEAFKKDIYYTSGKVWDHEKLTVAPVFIPMPEAKFD
ncbi:hypothetical protein C8Q79DRAFT_912402 [Trametes meyenii]|nr:hypothetical protein C8Q79DRAFT_912402 [Trametes meyenii]